MKRILKAAEALAVLVLGASLAFADEAEYKKLLAEGKQYEEKKQWVHAMGTYWDAIEAEPTEKAKEAYDAFVKLEDVIKSGKPGYGEFDEFSLHDGFVELRKEFEAYFTENPARAFYLGQLQKGALDYKNRTANYFLTVNAPFAQKCLRMLNAIAPNSQAPNGIGGIYSWPYISEYAEGFEEGSYLKNGVAIFYQNGDEIKKHGGGTLNSSWYGPKNIAPAAFATEGWGGIDEISSRVAEIVSEGWAALSQKNADISLYDVELSIVDEQGNVLATGERKLINRNKYKNENIYTFTGISQSTMKLIDDGKATVVPSGLFLKYGKPTGSAISNDEDNRTWLKSLPEIKYDVSKVAWSKEQDINVIATFEEIERQIKLAEQKAAEEAAAKAAYEAKQAAFAQMVLDENGGEELSSECILKNNKIGYGYYIAGACTDQNKAYKRFKNDGLVEIPLAEYLSQLKAITGKDYKQGKVWMYDNTVDHFYYREVVFREPTDEELTNIQADIISESFARKWYDNARDNHKQRTLAEDTYNYLLAKKYFEKGGLQTNLTELEITEKKGVFIVSAIQKGSNFELYGIKKKDVISKVTVKTFEGETRTVQPSKLKTILAPATCFFTIERGKGKKTQILEIEFPVEWNKGEYYQNYQSKKL